MKKEIIRTKTVMGVTSKLLLMGENSNDVKNAVNKFGAQNVLSQLFEETDYTYEQLLSAYRSFLNGGKSDCFAWMLRLNEKYGVVIDSHIQLYHGDEKLVSKQQQVFGWGYMDSVKYMGDVWYFSDEEILSDIQLLSVIEFMDKYKGFMG